MLHGRCELECLTRAVEALVVFVSKDWCAIAINIDVLIEKIYEVLFLIHLNNNQWQIKKKKKNYRRRDTTHRRGSFRSCNDRCQWFRTLDKAVNLFVYVILNRRMKFLGLGRVNRGSCLSLLTLSMRTSFSSSRWGERDGFWWKYGSKLQYGTFKKN